MRSLRSTRNGIEPIQYPREGVGNWVWAAVQPLLAVFAIYPSRARYVILD